jgi:plasmid stabilization system protein ParE
MNVRLLAAAAAELDEAVAWYASQTPGLERRFIDEVRKARKRIAERPHAWRLLGDGVRRFRLGRFPYGLIYVVESGEIVVCAIAHLHRKPKYRRSRLSRPTLRFCTGRGWRNVRVRPKAAFSRLPPVRKVS